MKIAAYCRVSTDKTEQASSLIHQKEFFIEYAKRNGHELFQMYADEGISGTSLKNRTAFNRLMKDARCGFFQAVVVKDISRLARNTVDFLVSIRELKAMGINVIFLNANMDSMGDSEFILTLFSAMAQEESANLSKRTKWGKKINAEKGRVPLRLFGYDRIDNFTLAINPEESKVVRKIFSLYNEQGCGCRTISLTLNRDGDKTKYGNDWNARGVRRVLVNPIYKGTLVNHKYEIEDFLTGKQVPIPEAERFYHERADWAIVTAQVFQRAQEIMLERRKKYDSLTPFRNGRYSSKHTFSTLIKCAHCGRSFTRKSYTYVNTRIYWRCVTNDQYTAETCDNGVILDETELLNQLRSYFSSLIEDRDGFIARVLSGLDRQLPDKEPQQRSRELETKRRRLLQKRSRFQELFADDLLTIDELRQKLSAISEELKAAELELEGLAQTAQLPGSSEELTQAYRREIEGFLALETVTNVEMRRLIDHICVDRSGNVQVVLRKIQELP